jgi:hypothetical protein
MKRILVALLLAVSLLIGQGAALAADHFGELNVKAGLNLTDTMKIGADVVSVRTKLDPCISLGGEYLIPAEHFSSSLDFFKFGVGLKCLFPTKPKVRGGETEFSYLPIYFTLQANPFVKSDKECLKGIFVKGDIGYNAYFSSCCPKSRSEMGVFSRSGSQETLEDDGGLYYAFGAGYEFPFGLVVDITYGTYKSSTKATATDVISGVLQPYRILRCDYTYSCVGLNIGYKFKI